MIGRRSFLTGLASALAAPAIVRAGWIMPVKAERLVIDRARVAAGIASLRPYEERLWLDHIAGEYRRVWMNDFVYGDVAFVTPVRFPGLAIDG